MTTWTHPVFPVARKFPVDLTDLHWSKFLGWESVEVGRGSSTAVEIQGVVFTNEKQVKVIIMTFSDGVDYNN